jgi:hypothetical protein
MALIRLAFGNFLPCSLGDREAPSKDDALPEIPTAIHNIRACVIKFEELQGKSRRSDFG